jgi:phosphopantetheinyl transferase
MPFSKKIETETGILGIWELTETADSLQAGFNFSENEKIEFERLRFPIRKLEYLASRILLQELLNKKAEIVYEKSGNPFLKNNSLNISISHSAQLLVVLVSQKNIGIDVEQLDRKIDKVANRFLSKPEMDYIQNNPKSQIAKIIYWGAKESIFKCTPFHGVQFDTQIYISPFKIEEKGTFSGKLTVDKTVYEYKLWYFFHRNNSIVFCVED